MAIDTLFVATANQSQAFLEKLTAELSGIREIVNYDTRTQKHIRLLEQGSISYASLWDFLNSAEGQDVTILHYIGHSSAQGLFIEGRGNKPAQVSTEALVGLFNQPGRFRFVFLNSCCSQAVANALLQAGVPYVIGTSAAIQDEQAVRVAKKFYEMLVKGYPTRTIEDAFWQTQLYFDLENNLQKPAARPDTEKKRGAALINDEDTDIAFPWQFYQREDLTDAQRKWRLIPMQQAVINKCFTVTPYPTETAYRPFSFFLGYTPADQTLATGLEDQISLTFKNYGSLSLDWSDETLTDPVARYEKLRTQTQKVDFVFLLLNEAFLADEAGKQVITLSRDESGRFVALPVVLPTALCNWQDLSEGRFNPYPLSGEPLREEMLTEFTAQLYKQVMNWLRPK